MAFIALDLSLQVIAEVRKPLQMLRQRDADLAKQLTRAASSIALNLGEGSRRRGKDRPHHYRIAAGSADELRVGLLVAQAWGHLNQTDIEQPLATLDELLAVLWKLTRT